MYRYLFILTSLIAQILPAQILNLSWIDQDAQSRAAGLKARMAPQGLKPVSTPSGMDIKYHRIELNLDPAVRFVKGSVFTRFVAKPGNLQSVVFDMHDSLHVTTVMYHGQPVTSYSRQDNKITINLSGQPINPDSIQIDYQGIPVDDELGSITFSKHGNVPVLYTLSEPYGARDWWPCSQELNDKIDSVLMVITVPAGNRAAANGMLISEQHVNGSSIYRWKHKHLISAYLIGVSVTNYSVYSDYAPVPGGKSIEILNYVYPEDSADIRAQTYQIIKPFQLYNGWFGLYPFADERYGHAQWNWGGGMENQTMSFMGSFGYDLMAHELGHQWFGDFLTCGSWRDIWLNEGFATYLTGLCYEHDQGGIYWEPFKRLSINRVIREPGGSVYCYDTTNVDRIFDARLSYSKGAMVLHMLRWEMGDENFFSALNNYLYDPRLANGYATTEDLIAHCEAVADTSFREFFNDWIYGTGYPKYEIIYRLNPDNEVELEISQEPSDTSAGFFEMDLPVRLYGKGVPAFAGMTSASYVTVVLKHTYNGQVFRINPGFRMDSLKFDPDRWICTANPIVLSVSEIPYNQQVKIYPNPVRDLLTIDMALPEAGLKIRMYNHKGQLIFAEETSDAFPRIQVPMSAYPKGVYTIQIEGRKTVSIVKD